MPRPDPNGRRWVRADHRGTRQPPCRRAVTLEHRSEGPSRRGPAEL